jgi:hypothetical protein
MPGCPLRRTSTRPLEGATTANATEAAYRPTWFFRYMHSPVGAGLPAMGVNDDVCCLKERGVWTSIAGKPAPTGFWVHPQKQIVSHRVPGTSARAGRLRGRLREQARSHSGLLAGMTLVFSPMILTDFRPAIRPPRFVFDLDLPRRKAVRQGRWALGYLALFQVTRRQGGTHSRRYRKNGYVHHQNLGQLTHRYRWQASSHRAP